MNEIERQIESMLENALDFFRVASQEIESNPKYSSIHFWSGFELILKARVCSEHWSFMIANKNPTLKNFMEGDFYSRNFEDLCEILEKITDTPIQKKHFNRLGRVLNLKPLIEQFWHLASRICSLSKQSLISA